jgi:CheY-like chemotaxis protein
MTLIKVLVVDDYAPLRRLISALLERRQEFQVTQSADGADAVRKATEIQPDVVLLDIALPKLNGIDAAKHILTLSPRSKLLFVSLQADSAVVQETFRLGGSGFVDKAFALGDLIAAIYSVLAGARFLSTEMDFKPTPAGPRHDIQFYSDDSVLVRSVTRFLTDAVDTTDAMILLATNSHRNRIERQLQKSGFDVNAAIEGGTYITLDADDTLSSIMCDGLPDPIRFSTNLTAIIESIAKIKQTEHPHVTIVGECAGLLCSQGNAHAAVTLEKTGNNLLRTHDLDILCTYPWAANNALDDHIFQNICEQHTTVYWR